MKVVLCYVYAPHLGGDYETGYAFRFIESYHYNPTTVPHDCLIVSNSGPISEDMQMIFATLKNCSFMQHDNSGFDIGAFQRAAREVPCDLMLFFGSSAHLMGPGWLERIVDSVNKHGDTLYGTMANAGDARVAVWPHIRTTGFWLSPRLMNQYPMRVTRADQRHPFEHKENCLTEWVRKRGLTAWVVTWNGDLPNGRWQNYHHGFQQGDQRGLIVRDRLCEPPFYWDH